MRRRCSYLTLDKYRKDISVHLKPHRRAVGEQQCAAAELYGAD